MWRREKCKYGLFLYPGSPQKGPQHPNLRQQKYQQLRQSVKVLMESIRPTLCDFPPSLRTGGRHISEITEVTILPSPSCHRMSTSNPALLQPPTVPVVSWREGRGGGFLVILGNLNCQCSSCVPQMCNVTPENKLLFPSNRQYSILLCEKCRLIN